MVSNKARPGPRQRLVPDAKAANLPTEAEKKDLLEKLSFSDASAAAKAESKWRRTAIFKTNKPLKDTSPIDTPSWLAFTLLALFNCTAAWYSPILDCDEVFNFWEPTHYLNHGYGLQTWEYSPDYAIRSWAYAGLHAVLTLPGRLFPAAHVSEFYTLRLVLGLSCAFCQTYMYTKIARLIHPKIGQFLLLVFLTSPGFFHAAVAYLPSSFAMYTVIMGIADFLDWRGGSRSAEGIFWFGLGTVLAWPFVGVLVVPFVAEEILMATYTSTIPEGGQRLIYGTSRSILALVVVFFFDLAFYRKYVCSSFNLVWYNIVAAFSSARGPNIFGTESWHFYIRNLVLNFHIWFPLALAALPALVYQEFFLHRPANRMGYIRNMTITSPLYLWLAIFTAQPHKEERFMYPAYPLIAVNAAITIHLLLMWLGGRGLKSTTGILAIPAKVRLAFVGLCLLGAVAWSALRIIGLVTAYGAPLAIYKPLHEPGMAKAGDTVCLGKEWYRFPSHYHLPAGVKAKFIKSEFNGLLPGEFSEAGTGFGLYPGAWLIPPGMNDENREDPGKYTQVQHCTYLVDSWFPDNVPSALEPDFVHDEENWQRVKCEPFLDASRSSSLGRLFWLPDQAGQHQRAWGQYCLLRNTKRVRA